MPESSLLLSPRAHYGFSDRRRAPRPPEQWGHKVHTVSPALSTDLEVLPRFTLERVFTDWGIDPIPFVVTVWAVGLYVLGVVVLHRRGDRLLVSPCCCWDC